MFYSPLRYPGGKNKLAKFVGLICKENNINGHYVEPYAGGASVALFLLFNGYVSKITINDIDRSIYAFWYSVLNHTDRFCKLIENSDVNIDTWYECKKIQNNKKKASLIQLGFSTFFLNRTNISGIINAGVIGGLEQQGKYKIDCRYNKKQLIERITNISKQKKNIRVFNLDALALIKKIQQESRNTSIIFYFDPPYYVKGESLYMNFYKHRDHLKVSKAIKKIKNARWIVSYDNVEEIKKMYIGCSKIEYSLFHTAHAAKKGNEVLFFSNNLNSSFTYFPYNYKLTLQKQLNFYHFLVKFPKFLVQNLAS
ncbi:MAG TPA: DNA adenine methylase [Patescibacteria group bacterium]|nr:DNA adenine methylase [Patescibacteria group bacterium]